MDAEALPILGEEHVPAVLKALLEKIEASAEYSAPQIAAMIKEVQKETGFKGKQLFMPIRVALTGQMHGRDLNETIYLLGKDRVIERLRSQIKGSLTGKAAPKSRKLSCQPDVFSDIITTKIRSIEPVYKNRPDIIDEVIERAMSRRSTL